MLSQENLELLRQGLFSGQYNLLLGSGVSLDSSDRYGQALKSARNLTEDLCDFKDVGKGTTLSRVSLLLEPNEIDKYLTQPYLGCRAGETVKRITTFVWRTIFTFNIDDALEAAYESVERPKQEIEPLNYDTLFKNQPNKSHLLIVHLHGFTREPEKGYVFSTTEYGRATRGNSAWMHILSELVATEPFIIAGTSLNEPDFEYYLAGRSAASARINRGPSILVEPYPDKITESICNRHGLILVKSTLSEFLKWLSEEIGPSPTVAQLTVPSLEGIFGNKQSAEDQVDFFSCFELIRQSAPNPDGEVSPFYFGKLARWSDFESSVDVPTDDERFIGAHARNWLKGNESSVKIISVHSEPGSGKTTIIRRIAYDLVKEGYIAFNLKENSVIDPERFALMLSQLSYPTCIVIDGLADHSAALRSLIAEIKCRRPILILSADRDYRRDHIDRIIGDLNIEYHGVSDWPVDSFEQLIGKLHRVGLLGHSDAVHYPRKFANQLVRDTIAVGVCRALNNFKPLEVIVRSLWADAGVSERRSYAIAAIAEHCYAGGVFHPILEKSNHNPKLKNQLEFDCPLPLTYSEDGDYVLPLYSVVADRLLHMLSREKQTLLLEMFSLLANALSPYVNRRATIDRTPEAKLAARLFSAEQVVRPFLGAHADVFFCASAGVLAMELKILGAACTFNSIK